MGKIDFGRVLDCFSLSICSNSCLCMESMESQDAFEGKALMMGDQITKLGDFLDENKTLAFHLEPKTVILRVSMHCNGCARKIQKHISKMEGVTSCEVELDCQKVVVIGDVTPFEVLASVSKVKSAELWVSP